MLLTWSDLITLAISTWRIQSNATACALLGEGGVRLGGSNAVARIGGHVIAVVVVSAPLDVHLGDGDRKSDA